MSLFIPPSPQQELDELCVLFGSQGAVARYLGRKPTLIGRWRHQHQSELRPQTVELIDDAWNVALSLLEVVGKDRLPSVVHQRLPALGRTPAQLIKERRGTELLEAISTEPASPGEAIADEQDDEALAAWFASVLTGEAEVAAQDNVEEEEFDEPLERGEWLSTAWRGGGTMSSDRWLRRE